MKERKVSKITSVRELEAFVKRCEKQVKRLTEAPEGAPPPVAAQTAPPAATDATAQPDVPQEQSADEKPTLRAIISQLNTIRAGRSTKDQDVKEEFKRYYDGLSEAERESLYAFLKGIAQLLSGQIDAAVATEPQSQGVVSSQTGIKHKTVKPNVVRTNQPQTAISNSKPAEDTTAPTPIVPKKR